MHVPPLQLLLVQSDEYAQFETTGFSKYFYFYLKKKVIKHIC